MNKESGILRRMTEYTNIAVQENDGWIWFDQFGKDYGPWSTKSEAEIKGKCNAAKEEKMLHLRNLFC